MDVCSPKDGFILEMYVKPGDPVDETTPICQIDTEHEERLLTQIDFAEKSRLVRAAQYTGEQLQILKDLADSAIAVANSALEPAKRLLQEKNHELNMYATTYVYLQAVQADTNAKQSAARAVYQRKQLDYAIDRHTALDEFARDQHLSRTDFLRRRVERA